LTKTDKQFNFKIEYNEKSYNIPYSDSIYIVHQ